MSTHLWSSGLVKKAGVLVCLVLSLSLALSACTANVMSSISGRIYDLSTGSAIRGATVTIEQYGVATGLNSGSDGTPIPVLPPADPHRETTQTGADGNYKFSGLPAGQFFVSVAAESYHESNERLSLPTSGTITAIDFALSKVSTIRGRVVDAAHKTPIAGATVFVWGPHDWMLAVTATTDSDGRYVVSGLKPGESTLAARASGYVGRWYPGVYSADKGIKVVTTYGGTTPNIDLELEVGGSISGAVYEPDGITPALQVGKPGGSFKESWVYFYQVSGVTTPVFSGGDLPMSPTRAIRANADGSFRIDGLLTGEFDLVAVTRLAEGALASAHRRVSVTTGREAEGIGLVSLPGGAVSGHVYLEDGVTPAEGLHISASIETGYPLEGYYYEAGGSSVSSDGTYSVDPLPPVKVHLRVSGDIRYAGRQYSTTVVAGQQTVLDIVLR
jgi:hypothetical protein